jgi:SAM-dependent methyltransferase
MDAHATPDQPSDPQPDPPGAVVVRRATPADAGELFTLLRAAYVTEAQLHDDAHLPPLRRGLDEVRTDLGRGINLLAERDGRIVATGRGERHGDVARLGRFAVAPDAQGTGLGTRIITALEAALGPEVERFELFTGEYSTRNLALYRRLGYHEVGREPVHDHAIVHLTKPALAVAQANAHLSVGVSPWIARFAPRVPTDGRVLDVAAGAGRHTRFFAGRGHAVLAVDVDTSALADLQVRDDLEVVEADLEADPWPLGTERFAAVVVTNYLHRPLLPTLVAQVAPGGWLLYETFARGHEAFGRPSNPDWLLAPGELLDAVAGELEVVAYEQLTLPRPARIQHLAARRRP